MKTRFYMLNLLAGIAFGALCLVSCGKGAFPDTDDSATRGLTLDTFIGPPVFPPPPLELNPIYCENSNGQTVESPLFVGISYTLKVNIAFHIDDIPTIEFAIRNSSGRLVLRPVESNSTTKQYTFTAPDVYTVVVTVTNKLGTETYERTYEVVKEGFDTSNPGLNVPFDLYLNSDGTDEVVLNVSETLFNDPRCTVSQPERGHFVICIQRPGKYEFRVRYPNRSLQPFDCYRANIFDRPRLVCISAPTPNGGYENYLQRWTSSRFEIPWFYERVAFSCYPTGYPEQAVSYTALKSDPGVQVSDTDIRYREAVYIREYANLYPDPIEGGWTVVYPRDTCYYFSKHIVIK